MARSDRVPANGLAATLLLAHRDVSLCSRRQLSLRSPLVEERVGEFGADVEDLAEALEVHLRSETYEQELVVKIGAVRTVPNCVTGMRM